MIYKPQRFHNSSCLLSTKMREVFADSGLIMMDCSWNAWILNDQIYSIWYSCNDRNRIVLISTLYLNFLYFRNVTHFLQHRKFKSCYARPGIFFFGASLLGQCKTKLSERVVLSFANTISLDC